MESQKIVITGSASVTIPAPAVEGKGTLIISGAGGVTIRAPRT